MLGIKGAKKQRKQGGKEQWKDYGGSSNVRARLKTHAQLLFTSTYLQVYRDWHFALHFGLHCRRRSRSRSVLGVVVVVALATSTTTAAAAFGAAVGGAVFLSSPLGLGSRVGARFFLHFRFGLREFPGLGVVVGLLLFHLLR